MPGNGSCKALALGGAGDVDHLARREDFNGEVLTRRHTGQGIGRYGEFTQNFARLDTCLGKMACLRLQHTGGALHAEGNLNGTVAVGLG